MSATPVVVIDNGSLMTKAGLAGQDAPSVTFPSIVGRLRHPELPFAKEIKPFYVGDEAQAKRGILTLRYPCENGTVKNWDDLEKVWQFIFSDKLQVAPDGCSVLLADAPLSPESDREKMSEIMFEAFQVPSLYIEMQAMLSLYAAGRETGVVIDCGDGDSHVVPIFQGSVMKPAICSLDVGGRILTDYLMKILIEAGVPFTYNTARLTVQDIKEQFCYVAQDLEKELAAAASSPSTIEISYELLSGEIITVGNERFRCPEAVFQTTHWANEQGPGIQQTTHDSILKCDPTMHADLYANIVLSGCSTMFPGFADRIQQEIAAIAPSSMEVKVFAPPERKYSAWLGGSKLASCAEFQEMCVSKQEYEESGSSIIQKKFSKNIKMAEHH